MRYNNFIFILVGVFLLSSVSAFSVDVSTNSISKSINQGEVVNVVVTYTINNTDSSDITYPINIPSSIPFMSSSVSSITIPSNTKVTDVPITFTFSPTIANDIGGYIGIISIGYQQIGITVDVGQDQTGLCKIYTLPIPLTKTLETGSTASQSIDVYISKYCTSSLQISTNQPQMVKPINFDSISGLVEPSQKFTIKVDYDATSVQKGTYTDNIVISGMDDNENLYNLNLPITLSITGSISPITNGTFTTLPTCSLSASEFMLNNTYSMICNSISPNIDVQPIIDFNYIKGIGVSETGDSYTYSFQPTKFGNTIIRARFLFKNAPIGNEYSQEVRIISSSGVVPGTSLALKFYPPLYQAKDGESIIVRAVDNKSGNILTDAKLYLDGIQVLNDSISLKSNLNYEIRASHIGYTDLVTNINLNPKLINFTINSNYNLGDKLNFTTDIEGATISLDDKLISLPFTLNEIGTFQISVSKLGYTTSYKNITVGSVARIIYATPIADLKKGGDVLVEFEKNDTKIYVDFQEDTTEPATILVTEFSGKEVKFETEKVGVYHVYADGEFMTQFSIESNEWYKSYWLWGTVAVVVFFGLILYYGLKEDEDELPPMA